MKRILSVALAVVAVGVAVAGCSSSYGKSQTQVTKCGVAEDGTLRVEGRIRNADSGRTNSYEITVDVTDGGTTVLGRAKATVNDVKPDSDARFVATSADKPPADAKLACTSIEIAAK